MDYTLSVLLGSGIPDTHANLYAIALVEDGFDCHGALRAATNDDFEDAGITADHMRLLQKFVATAVGKPKKTTAKEKAKPKAAKKPAAKKAKPKQSARSTRADWSSPTDAHPPLYGLVLCVTGQMSMVRKQFFSHIQSHGGAASKTVTNKCTHLVTTEAEVDAPTRKMLEAMRKGCPVVNEDFVTACISEGYVVDEEEYLLWSPEDDDDDDDDDADGTAGGAASTRQILAQHQRNQAAKPAKAPRAKASQGGNAAGGGAGGADVPVVGADPKAVASAMAVMLADKWTEKVDPKGYWLSEKLDGVRAYWSGYRIQYCCY
jgi:hypothetical protein